MQQLGGSIDARIPLALVKTYADAITAAASRAHR
jgi:hypothetical protein